MRQKGFFSKVRNKIKMPALPTVHSTHPGVPERVIRQEKEPKDVRIGKEEADLGLETGDSRPGLVTPLAASLWA